MAVGPRILNILKQVTVEPLLFFCMFGYAVRLVSMQDLLIDRGCRVILKYSDSVCDNLELKENLDFKNRAVSLGNNLNVGNMMVATVPALVVAIFLGPWSDRYSRKYPLIIAITGILIDTTINALITAKSDSSPYWYIASAITSGVSGGFIMTLSASYSYMSDITDERSRPTRYAILEFFTILATPLGALIGGQVYKHAGYFAVMLVGPCSFALALLWAVFVVKETKQRQEGVTLRQMFRDLFTLDNMRSSIQTCLKPRAGNLRKQIWLLVLISCTVRIVQLGTLGIGYPFTKVMYNWDVTTYSNATTLFSLFTAFATLTLVPILNKKLMLHEAAVGFIGISSLMAKMVINSVAFEQSLIYYAWFCGSFYACSGIAVRSRISKLVSKQELGRTFSLLATCESLMPVIGTATMTQLLNVSLTFYPGLPFAISALILVPGACIFVWMMRMPTMSFAQYQEQDDSRRMEELKSVTEADFK